MRIRSNEEHFRVAEAHILSQEEARKAGPPAVGIPVKQHGHAVGIDEVKAELEKGKTLSFDPESLAMQDDGGGLQDTRKRLARARQITAETESDVIHGRLSRK